MGEFAARSGQESKTPAADGMFMPARFSSHARTLLTWPPAGETALDQFRTEVESVAHAIARFEPVTLVVDPSDAEELDRRATLRVVIREPSDARPDIP